MTGICNYRDIPDKKKDAVLEQLLGIGFCPAHGNRETMKKEMEKSQAGTFPQYLFVFRDDKLIGYMFLIAETENYCKVFPWWAVDNSDELPLDISIQLLEYGIQLSLDCNCPGLSNRLKLQLENQKTESEEGRNTYAAEFRFSVETSKQNPSQDESAR